MQNKRKNKNNNRKKKLNYKSRQNNNNYYLNAINVLDNLHYKNYLNLIMKNITDEHMKNLVLLYIYKFIN